MSDWQYTEPIPSGSFFRIKHTEAPNGGLFAIAQCEVDAEGKLSLIDSQILAVEKPIIDVIKFVLPGCFAERRIAIKKLPKQPTLEQEVKRLFLPGYLQPSSEQKITIVSRSNWTINIEVSDFVEPSATVDLTPIQIKLDEISSKIDGLQQSSNTGGSTGGTTTNSKTLTYVSDGDTNGVFYYLGTNKNTQAWANPASAIVFTASSFLSGRGPDKLADRSINEITNDAHTNTENNAWFKVDLGSANKLAISYYTLQARNTTDQQPRSWILQGSKDDLTYIDIDSQSNNSILSNGTFYSKGISNQTESYRYYKLTQTGLNSSGANYFVLGEWELYGTLTF